MDWREIEEEGEIGRGESKQGRRKRKHTRTQEGLDSSGGRRRSGPTDGSMQFRRLDWRLGLKLVGDSLGPWGNDFYYLSFGLMDFLIRMFQLLAWGQEAGERRGWGEVLVRGQLNWGNGNFAGSSGGRKGNVLPLEIRSNRG